jgi:hypothetical protein
VGRHAWQLQVLLTAWALSRVHQRQQGATAAPPTPTTTTAPGPCRGSIPAAAAAPAWGDLCGRVPPLAATVATTTTAPAVPHTSCCHQSTTRVPPAAAATTATTTAATTAPAAVPPTTTLRGCPCSSCLHPCCPCCRQQPTLLHEEAPGISQGAALRAGHVTQDRQLE